MFQSLINEWSHFPELLATLPTSLPIWGITFLGALLGYIIGVLPGLGATMGMVLMLGVVSKIPAELGIALMTSILTSSLCSGGVTASLINIPGTPAAAATCLDGYPLFKMGKGREAVGAAVTSSALGTTTGLLVILIIQPLIFSIALLLGDWEIFLFCVFGVLICGALSGDSLWRGLAAGMLGLVFATVGLESLQAVKRFTFGTSVLLAGIPEVSALLGLFGLSEVFFTIHNRVKVNKDAVAGVGWMVIPFKLFKQNIWNMVRSLFVGLWVGFIPGVGESAACWVSYDVAKRNSKKKELFGKGSFEGIIAAETANNASSIGALIPALSLGIPGSATSAIFIAALFLMDYQPGPTLMQQAPGIVVKITILAWMGVIMSFAIALALSKVVTKFFTIPQDYLMPIVAVLCIVGAWGTGFTKHHIVVLLFFGILGFLMKTHKYPVAPMVLGLLIGKILDTSFRRALTQYSVDPLQMFMRPFGIFFTIILIGLFVLGVKSSKKSEEEKEHADTSSN